MRAPSKDAHLSPRRTPLAQATVVLAVALCWIVAAQASSARPAARAARTLNVTDEAHLHVTHTDGELLEEEGPATGALPGTVNVRFRIGASVSGTFTIYPRGGGSISGQGSARLHSSGTYASFGGSTVVNRGTGRYAHVHGHGDFYGTFDRHNQALIIQTTGYLSY
jgi:hypothetical protein